VPARDNRDTVTDEDALPAICRPVHVGTRSPTEPGASAYARLIGTRFRDSVDTGSVKAYVLINASPGRSLKLAAEIRSVPGIRDADAITGEYDIIALGEAPDVHTLGALVVNHIQKLEGVWDGKSGSSSCRPRVDVMKSA